MASGDKSTSPDAIDSFVVAPVFAKNRIPLFRPAL
jgi:hypothetical protein